VAYRHEVQLCAEVASQSVRCHAVHRRIEHRRLRYRHRQQPHVRVPIRRQPEPEHRLSTELQQFPSRGVHDALGRLVRGLGKIRAKTGRDLRWRRGSESTGRSEGNGQLLRRRFGQARGDELPAELADPVTRRERLERAARELEAEHAARQAEYQARLQRREEYRKRTGKGLVGRKPHPPQDGQLLESKRNVTDPDSRIMDLRGSLIQGYNAQAVVGEGQVIIAAGVTNSPNDSNQLRPMLEAARTNLDHIGHEGRVKCALADGGYWHHDQITQVRANKTIVIIPTSDPHRTSARTLGPRQGPEAKRINRMLAAEAGRKLYRRRAGMVEPVYAQTKHNRWIRAFTRRGLAAVTAEWQLIAAAHNLVRLFGHQPATT